MSLIRARLVIVVVAAFAVAAVGVARLATSLAAPAVVSVQATVDSLTAQVSKAGWTEMDTDMADDTTGYQMPPAMMPGMPENGDERLSVSVTVVNTSGDTRLLRPDEEFALRTGADGKRRAPHSDTFGDLPRLAPHNAVQGTLFFDLKPAELTAAPAYIEWTHEGTASRLTIPMDGVRSGPTHSHGS
ncbi:hypothetical protein [Actinophytocola sp.]|uniref:hypothetical protein n=1 Tax=Actinophytocola sp. TaxID=1872138 RepID=UPI003899A27F